MENPSDAKKVQVPRNKTTGNVLPDLLADTEYQFQVTAKLSNGDELKSAPTPARTLAEGKLDLRLSIRNAVLDITCHCSHSCKLVFKDGKTEVECSCPEGYRLLDDQRTCSQVDVEGADETVIQVDKVVKWVEQTLFFRSPRHLTQAIKRQKKRIY